MTPTMTGSSNPFMTSSHTMPASGYGTVNSHYSMTTSSTSHSGTGYGTLNSMDNFNMMQSSSSSSSNTMYTQNNYASGSNNVGTLIDLGLPSTGSSFGPQPSKNPFQTNTQMVWHMFDITCFQ
jgi:hypothetical protein